MSMLLLAAALLVAPAHSAALGRLRGLFPSAAQTEAAPRRPWLPSGCAGLAAGLFVAVVLGGTSGLVLAGPLGLAAGWGTRRVARGGAAPGPDPLRLAGGWDLMAACLRCGLPVPLAVSAVAEYLPGAVALELRTVADRLALGADPRTAWAVPEHSPVYKLAQAASRSAHSGTGLAKVAVSVAAEVRTGAQDLAAARGQRATVLITGPLGLCFLPAFLALGVVPVVIGLASSLALTW